MKKHASFGIIALFSTLLLTSCVSNRDNFTNVKVTNHWRLNGKIGLVYPEANCAGEDCRLQSDQGNIIWQQQGQTYAIQLSDPFGRVVMTITGDNQQLQSTVPKQQTIHTTPNEFVAIIANHADNQALSTLSPAWLRYWVTGRPAPGIDVTKQSNDEFIQDGYRVTAKQWRSTPVGKMPSLIVVTKQQFTLRLVVRAWTTIESS